MFIKNIVALFRGKTANYMWAVSLQRISVEIYVDDKDSGKVFEGEDCLSRAYDYALDSLSSNPERKKYFRGAISILVLAPFQSQNLVASRVAPVEPKLKHIEQDLTAADFEENTLQEFEAKAIEYFSDRFSAEFPS